MKKLLVSLTVCIVSGITTLPAFSATTTPILFDDFTGTAGASPDVLKWTATPGITLDGAGNAAFNLAGGAQTLGALGSFDYLPTASDPGWLTTQLTDLPTSPNMLAGLSSIGAYPGNSEQFINIRTDLASNWTIRIGNGTDTGAYNTSVPAADRTGRWQIGWEQNSAKIFYNNALVLDTALTLPNNGTFSSDLTQWHVPTVAMRPAYNMYGGGADTDAINFVNWESGPEPTKSFAPAGYVSALDFGPGFDAADSTAALQIAFDSGLDIYVPKTASNWIASSSLLLTNSDQNILFEDGVVLEAAVGAFTGTHDSLIEVPPDLNLSNVRLEGYGATLRMRQSEYTPGNGYPVAEWRHGIMLDTVDNFEIVGLTIEDTGGDGIYVGGNVDNGLLISENVTIQDVVINNAYRNGIGVAAVDTLLIDNTVIVDTGGTAPEAGIDFEPDNALQVILNVTVRDSIIVGSAADGITWNFGNAGGLDAGTTTGTIENVTIYDSGRDGLSQRDGPFAGWNLQDVLVINSGSDGYEVGNGTGQASIENSAFFGNVGLDFNGDIVAGGGSGTITSTAPVFVNTDDPTNPLYFYLDPTTSTLISLGASDGSFMGARGVAGDFDEDAGIDGFDFLAWQRGESPNNGNADDLSAWEMFFGAVGAPLSGLAAGVGAVPEPSSAVLFSLALAGLAISRRRRK